MQLYKLEQLKTVIQVFGYRVLIREIMKFATFFAFVAFVLVAQAHANTINNGSIDRGLIADSLKLKLTAAKEKLEELLSKADNFLKEKIAEAKNQAELLIDQIREKAGQISEQLYEAVQNNLDKVGELEDKVIEQARNIINKYGNK